MLFTELQIDKLIFDAHDVITRVVGEHHPWTWAPLLSGGHDSICAVHLASTHPARPRPFVVRHIDTGTGAKYTRELVEKLCAKEGWELQIHKSPEPEDTYEGFVAEQGMPGPGMHQWVYVRLKERCVQQITIDGARGQRPTMLISGVRKDESFRRMGHSQQVRRGDGYYKDTGNLRNPSRLWVAPCFTWTTADQQAYMDEFGLPVNKLKVAIGLSGECFCGCYAKPGERERIKEFAPDVDAILCRHEGEARRIGKQWCEWGKERPTNVLPDNEPELFSMDLCVGCISRQ